MDQLHGGFLAGLGLLGLWGLLHAARHWTARWKFFWPLFSTLANPYGHELLVFLLHTATVPRPEILEWQPLARPSAFGAVYAIVLATTALSLGLSGAPRNPVLMALLALLALLPWIALRHLPLFCMSALVFAGEHAADA